MMAHEKVECRLKTNELNDDYYTRQGHFSYGRAAAAWAAAEADFACIRMNGPADVDV